MVRFLSKICPLIFILACTEGVGVGKAWRVLPYTKFDYWDHPSWPRLDSSAFEVRSVSGVGRLVSFDDTENTHKHQQVGETNPKNEHNDLQGTMKYTPNEGKPTNSPFDRYAQNDAQKEEQNVKTNSGIYEKHTEEGSTYYDKKINDDTDDMEPLEKIFRTGIMMKVLEPHDREDLFERAISVPEKITSRVRREAENETKMEKIATTKNVREVRLNSPETWSTQPISVEFRHRASLDQMIQQAEDEMDSASNIRSHHAPHADFVTSHHRRTYGENRETREMPATRTTSYDEYDFPWYRNMIRERDYDPPMSYRRGFSYHYPDRYRTERDYYTRTPNEPAYYYDRYRDDDFDLYGRSRPTPKPKRIIYYATLPEIVRKPVDLRNYPRPYDGLMRTPVLRDGTYKRIPGNVDPSRYRYKHLYDGYDSYAKRSSIYDRPYVSYQDDEDRRKGSIKEGIRNNDGFEQNSDRKLSNQISMRNEGKLPWPVQIGTEVSVKNDERIPGRKVFGENNGFERFQSAQLQKAPDATGSSELQSDN